MSDPSTRTIQSDQELHIGLRVPRHTARQIFLWAQSQDWPEGTELEPPSEYHVTLLYTPSGYEEHKDAWWLEHMEGSEVEIQGFSSFPAQEKGYAYVLRLDAPEVKDHADILQGRAEAMGLEITHFPGGYKPHLTVGYGPNKVTGIRVPNFQFDIGPSSVSSPRIDKTAAKRDRWHINTWTGLPCDCGWGSPKRRRGEMTRTAGVEMRKLLKAPDKAWRTPKGDAFRQHLATLPEEYDGLMPYLAQRYKKGDVRLMGEPGEYGALRYINSYHSPPWGQQGPDAPRWANAEAALPRWNQWFQARQHPTRRGVNVMDPSFDPIEMNEKVHQHQVALEEARKKERWLGEYGPNSYDPPNIVHTFGPEAGSKYQGWNVVRLDPRQAEGDSAANGYCIGWDDQPYKHNIDIGNIDAYSLRDREGYPHVSWHFNPSGADIGHMQGASGYPKGEYRHLMSKFHEAHDLPDEEGYEEELEPPYDADFWFPEAADMEDYISYHHPEHFYDSASENANIGEDTEFHWEPPRWDSIAQDYLSNGGANDDFYHTLKHEGHWADMAQALHDEADYDDENHRNALNRWNQYAPARHEIETRPPPANEVDKYNEIHNEGNFPAWPDDWGHLARDYLDYYDNYSKPGWHATIPSEYDQFHTNLGENGHAPNMRKALMANIDWEDEDHQKAANTWNYGMPRHNIHPPEPEQPQPEVSPNQFGFQWSPVRQNWEDPTLGIEDRLRQYVENRNRGQGQGGTFSRVAYNPDRVEVLDNPLRTISAQLHHAHKQSGCLNSQLATDHAARLLRYLGYPTDRITVQAAIQTWQTEYPDDKVEVSDEPEKFAPDASELSQTLGDDRHSTVPTQVNNPEDHWPEFGELPPDRKHDVQFSNDWAWHQG